MITRIAFISKFFLSATLSLISYFAIKDLITSTATLLMYSQQLNIVSGFLLGKMTFIVVVLYALYKIESSRLTFPIVYFTLVSVDSTLIYTYQ
jgi:hypothetical protein